MTNINNGIPNQTDIINELETKLKLVSMLLSSRSNNEGVILFKNVLYNDFLEFANKEDTVANEAELFLDLQHIEKELELISAYPDLHVKTLIAVGGGFSAGKSEFISSFIKGKIKLPVGVIPTTAIPTYVLNDNQDKFIGCSARGGIINFRNIDKNFHEKLSHNFIKSFGFNLKEIMPYIILATRLEYKNICFLDTPGYNPAETADGFTDEDINTAREFLKKSNYFLWLIGADAHGTISANDLDFLDSLDLHGKKLYVILNKADLRPLDEIKVILDDIRDNLDDYDIEYVGISAYSAITKEEYAYHKLSLKQFLDSCDIITDRHRELIERVNKIYLTYKYGLLKSINEKESIRKELHSLSLDILEEGVDIDNQLYSRISQLKNFFSTDKEEENVKLLDIVIKKLKEGINIVFGKRKDFDIPINVKEKKNPNNDKKAKHNDFNDAISFWLSYWR